MKIKTEIDILCMPEVVFSWIDNPDKAKHWQKGVKSETILKETPGKIGTTFKEEIQEKGKSLEMYGEIKDFIPDRLISFHLESKIHKVHVVYTVFRNKLKSTVVVESIIKWKFPMNLICIFIGYKIKRNFINQTKTELNELRNLCEK